MRVLCIGHGREGTGWSQAFIDYTLAMDSVGLDVVVRNVKLGMPTPKLPQRFLELEDKDSQGCDVCIQHLLCHHYDFNGGFKQNIAIYATETSDFRYSGWTEKINTMDRAWVINKQMVKASRDSGVTIPIDIVNHAVDVKKFQKEVEPLNIPPLDDTFVFYFIGDMTRRKHLTSLISAFHTEFLPCEPVSLVIKTSKFGISGDECTKEVANICNEIKKALKLYPSLDQYKPEIIICNHLSEDELFGLHKVCDCFVMPSFGEAWCIPAMDALGFGNPVICTKGTGMDEFVNTENGWLVNAQSTPCTGMGDTFPELFTGFETWLDISIPRLRRDMREAFGLYSSSKDTGWKYMQDNAKETPQKFSYEVIGNRIKELLCQVQ